MKQSSGFAFGMRWEEKKKTGSNSVARRDAPSEAVQSHDIPGLEQLDRELLDRHGAPAARAPFSSCNEKRRRMRSEEAGDDGSGQILVETNEII